MLAGPTLLEKTCQYFFSITLYKATCYLLYMTKVDERQHSKRFAEVRVVNEATSYKHHHHVMATIYILTLVTITSAYGIQDLANVLNACTDEIKDKTLQNTKGVK